MTTEERVYIRIASERYSGPSSFKIPPETQFRQLQRLLKVSGSLRYKGAVIDPNATPSELGMQPGVKNAVKIELVEDDAKASSAEPTPAAAKWAAPPHAAGGTASEPASPAKVDTPRARSPPAPTPKSAVVRSEEGKTQQVQPSRPPAPPVVPKDRPRPAEEETLESTQRPSDRQRDRPPAPSSVPSPPLVPHREAHRFDVVSRDATPAHAAPRAQQPERTHTTRSGSAAPVAAMDIAPVLGGPGRAAAARRSVPKDHSELQRSAQPWTGTPNHALDRHQRDEGRHVNRSPQRGTAAPSASYKAPLPGYVPTALPAACAGYGHGAFAAPAAAHPAYHAAAHPHHFAHATQEWPYSPPRAADLVTDWALQPAPAMLTAAPSAPPPTVGGAAQGEVDALRRDVQALRVELDRARDELADERAHREVMEGQMRQLAALILELQQQQREAAADEYAAREHQRLMATLREQRKGSGASLPRD